MLQFRHAVRGHVFVQCFLSVDQGDFSADDFFMAALCNRAGHIYFHPVISFYLLFFTPRLISAATDWMSTTLLHMVWP